MGMRRKLCSVVPPITCVTLQRLAIDVGRVEVLITRRLALKAIVHVSSEVNSIVFLQEVPTSCVCHGVVRALLEPESLWQASLCPCFVLLSGGKRRQVCESAVLKLQYLYEIGPSPMCGLWREMPNQIGVSEQRWVLPTNKLGGVKN